MGQSDDSGDLPFFIREVRTLSNGGAFYLRGNSSLFYFFHQVFEIVYLHFLNFQEFFILMNK